MGPISLKLTFLADPPKDFHTGPFLRTYFPVLPGKSFKVPPCPPWLCKPIHLKGHSLWEFMWIFYRPLGDFLPNFLYTWVFVGGELSPPTHIIQIKIHEAIFFSTVTSTPKDNPPHSIKWASLREGMWLENSEAVQLAHSHSLDWELLAKCYRNIIIGIY